MENSLSNFRYNLVGGIDADKVLPSGEIVPYTLTIKEVEELGDVQITPVNLQFIKAIKIDEIKKYRDNLTQRGGYKAQGKWFHSDTFSRSQQIGLVMLGTNIPVGLMWKTMDGSFIEMNQQLANEVFTAAAVQDSTLFAHAEVLIQQVLNLETLQEVKDFDITQGWPETFLTL